MKDEEVMSIDILYKSGVSDTIEQTVSNEHKESFASVIDMVKESMREGTEGVITLGDAEDEGHFIRVSEISRLKIKQIS